MKKTNNEYKARVGQIVSLTPGEVISVGRLETVQMCSMTGLSTVTLFLFVNVSVFSLSGTLCHSTSYNGTFFLCHPVEDQ